MCKQACTLVLKCPENKQNQWGGESDVECERGKESQEGKWDNGI
jgi:hypothetical protein